ncbi:hypothetical protein [Nocardia sp. NPDC052566]|uniref:hypothetical protein n=1 Tax=Nocardia sp. NPDC052566 TaxID=3364330 RepID=UPI0037CBABCE
MAKAFCTITGVVEAPHATLVELLTTVHAGPIGPDNAFFLAEGPEPEMTLTGGPNHFRAPITGHPKGIRVDVDRARALLTVENPLGFRAECQVTPHPKGARLTQQVFPTGATGRLMFSVLGRKAADQQRIGMQRLLARITEHLDCPAYLE